MQHLETVAFLPTYIFIYKYTKKIHYARLFFHTIVVFLAAYEINNKKLYYLDKLDKVIEYNYIGEKCLIIGLQYFSYDLIYISKPIYLIHHCLFIAGILYGLQNQIYGNLTLYIYLNEISSIFLDLKCLNIYYNLSNILFKINFLIFRIILLPILTYYSRNNLVAFNILSTDCVIHGIWFYKGIKNKE